MTGRSPRSLRGRALPRSGTDTVSWPPALRGRSPLVVLTLLGWLGGGLLSTAVAFVTDGPDALAHELATTAAACLGLLLLAVVPHLTGGRTRPDAVPQPLLLGEPAPAVVPVQAHPYHDDRREPALH